MAEETRRLGKGLSALINTDSPISDMSRKYIEDFDVERIVPNPYQPRMHIDPEKLIELADSIREHGVIQPLIISKDRDSDKYNIVAGERRFRAVQLAGFKTVPVVIKETSPLEMLELALIENIQREDLNPLEESYSFKQLSTEFGLTQEEISKRVGLNRVTVANKMRLYRLPEKIKELVLNESISEGHARALLGIKDETSMIAAADIIVKRGLSVRQTEALVRKIMFGKLDSTKEWKRSDQNTKRYEEDITKRLGYSTTITKMSKGGKITIRYRTLEELDGIVQRFEKIPELKEE
ncbi:MAG: ParB/RepB/Spo0J family partition protein [Candidatus Dojkabacteria bacterium]|nr:ParB/RepB/Spo0J family partition protein [Candidatus Dojkabacteria bacterium]